MNAVLRALRQWTTSLPILGLALIPITWERDLPTAVSVVVALVMGGAVLAAVHHAEVVAHRVGEPFGSLILAVAVTVIEVGLILTLMLSGDSASTASLARDTVFAAVMITCNGILGASILVASIKYGIPRFNAAGAGGGLATVATLATLCLVLPRFTTSEPGPVFTTPQLVFAAIASLALYASYVFTQTVRHRDFFLPVDDAGKPMDDSRAHADPPSNARTFQSVGLLLVALIGVVGLAKVLSPTIESAVASVGFPYAVVGVIIALLVLLPESIAAVRAARLNRVQTSVNLAFGSAIASIGLTIPTIAVLSFFIDTDLALGLDLTHMVLLGLTLVVGVVTVMSGRTMRLEGIVHLIILSAYVFLATTP